MTLPKKIEYYLDNFIIEDPSPASNFGENILKKIEETIN